MDRVQLPIVCHCPERPDQEYNQYNKKYLFHDISPLLVKGIMDYLRIIITLLLENIADILLCKADVNEKWWS